MYVYTYGCRSYQACTLVNQPRTKLHVLVDAFAGVDTHQWEETEGNRAHNWAAGEDKDGQSKAKELTYVRDCEHASSQAHPFNDYSSLHQAHT